MTVQTNPNDTLAQSGPERQPDQRGQREQPVVPPPNVSVILATGARYTLPLMLLFSVFILLRGHNLPGGGFIGGLVAASAYALFVVAYDVASAQRVLRVPPPMLIGVGLLIAVFSGMIAMFVGLPFMTGLWIPFEIPGIGKVGTPTLFDIGVFLVVIGVVLTIVFDLAEE